MITLDNNGRMLPLSAKVYDWALFYLFMLDTFPEIEPCSFEHHVDWVAARDFTPNTWLGAEGQRWRKMIGMKEPSDELKQQWIDYQHIHLSISIDRLSSEIEAILINLGLCA
jgi:hypothetical protein